MGQSIEEYADALYIKKLSDARKKHTQELNEASRQMGQRGLTRSGIALGKMIEIDAAFIGRQMKARLSQTQLGTRAPTILLCLFYARPDQPGPNGSQRTRT